MSPAAKATLASAALGAIALILLAQRREQRRLADEIELLHRQQREATQLKAGNAELARSVAALDARLQSRETARADDRTKEASAGGGFTSVKDLREAGRATVRDAVETYERALTSDDPAALAPLLILNAASRARIETLYRGLPEADRARYGNAGQLFAMLYLQAHPPYFSGLRVESPEPAPDVRTAAPEIEYAYDNGHVTRHNDTLFRRTDEGWGVLVGSGTVAQALRQLEAPGR